MNKATPFDGLVAALERAHEVLEHESEESSPEGGRAMTKMKCPRCASRFVMDKSSGHPNEYSEPTRRYECGTCGYWWRVPNVRPSK